MKTLRHMLRRLLEIQDALQHIKAELQECIQLYNELRNLLNTDDDNDDEAVGKIHDITADVTTAATELAQVLPEVAPVS